MLESLEGKRGMVRAEAAAAGARRAVRQADRRQQRADAGVACPASWPTAPSAYAALGIGRSRGTQVFQLAGNIAHGGIVETRLRHHARRARRRTSAAARASGRPVRAVQVGGPLGAYLPADAVRPADGLRGVRRGGRDGRPRRHRRVRRHRRHGRAGPVRDGVLRRGVVRQVHALPGRLGPRRRGDRPDHRRTRTATTNLVLLDDLCEVDDRRLAVRDGRPHADAGAQRAHDTSPRGLRTTLSSPTTTASDGGAPA